MKVLDRYLIRELLFPVIYCAIILVFLILIADLFDNLDEFLRHETPFHVFVQYYACLVPYAFTQIIPWSAWLGTIFLLVSFGFHNELLAMKVAGLKITTIIRPLVFIGFLIGILTFIMNDQLVPWTYRLATELKEIYIEKKKEEVHEQEFNNVTFDSEGKYLYFMRALVPSKNQAEDIIILWRDTADNKTRQKIAAKRGTWTEEGGWEFEEVMEHQIDARGRVLGEPAHFLKKNYPEIYAKPEDLANSSQPSIYLTYREMKQSMKKLRETGVDVYSEKVDLYDRLASPWNSLVMMMIAIPLLGRTRTRKGIATAMLFCVGLIFVYHVAGAISLALGKSGKIPAFLSAWGANIIFSVAALLNLEKANY